MFKEGCGRSKGRAFFVLFCFILFLMSTDMKFEAGERKGLPYGSFQRCCGRVSWNHKTQKGSELSLLKMTIELFPLIDIALLSAR